MNDIDTVPNNQMRISKPSSNGVSFPNTLTSTGHLFGGSSPYSYMNCMSYSYGTFSTNGNLTMSRTYSTAVSGTHIGFLISSQRPANSAAATVTNTVQIVNGTLICRPFPIAKYEYTDLINTPIKFLKPTSPRFQQLECSFSGGAPRRIVLLPRADCLPLGTSFHFSVGSASTTQIYVLPYSYNLYSSSVASQWAPNISAISLSSAAGQLIRATYTLADNSGAGGLWTIQTIENSAANKMGAI